MHEGPINITFHGGEVGDLRDVIDDGHVFMKRRDHMAVPPH